MKQIKIFLSMIIFAVCASFSVYAESPPKLVSIKPQNEKISPKRVMESPAPNFVRTDSLVFYETSFDLQDDFESGEDQNLNPCSELSFDTETFFVTHFADSKYFRPKLTGKRLTEFIYS